MARAQARGKQDADVTVYENAVVAAAQGLAAMNAEIDAQYDKEYALIQLMEDSTERQNAMEALNAKYNENRRNAALEYAELLSDVVPKVWAQADIQQAASDVDTLTRKLREYSAAGETEKPALLEDLSAIAAAMDEGAMTEYLAMLTQIQSLLDSGLSESEIQAMFPEIDFTTALEQIAAIQTFLNNRELELPGLAEMFGDALPEEVLTIATDLDMTGAQERWDTFAADPGAITTDAIIAELREDENTKRVQPQVEAFIAKYTEVPEGADKAELTPEGIDCLRQRIRGGDHRRGRVRPDARERHRHGQRLQGAGRGSRYLHPETRRDYRVHLRLSGAKRRGHQRPDPGRDHRVCDGLSGDHRRRADHGAHSG